MQQQHEIAQSSLFMRLQDGSGKRPSTPRWVTLHHAKGQRDFIDVQRIDDSSLRTKNNAPGSKASVGSVRLPLSRAARAAYK